MPKTKSWPRRSQLLVIAAALLGATGPTNVLARQAATPGSQMAAMSGTGLTRAQCEQRMRDLNTLLGGAGYRSMSTRVMRDGTLMARWYNTESRTTALAFSGQLDTGNAFSSGEYPGYLRWNEFIALP